MDKAKVKKRVNHRNGDISLRLSFSSKGAGIKPRSKKVTKNKAKKKFVFPWIPVPVLLCGVIALLLMLLFVKFFPISQNTPELQKREVYFSSILIVDKTIERIEELINRNNELLEKIEQREEILKTSSKYNKRQTISGEKVKSSEYIWGEPKPGWKKIGELPSRYGKSSVYWIPSEPTH